MQEDPTLNAAVSIQEPSARAVTADDCDIATQVSKEASETAPVSFTLDKKMLKKIQLMQRAKKRPSSLMQQLLKKV